MTTHKHTCMPDIGHSKLVSDILEIKSGEGDSKTVPGYQSDHICPILRISKQGVVLYANKASEPLLHVWGCRTGGRIPDFWRKKVADIFNRHEERIENIACGDFVYNFSIDPILNAGHVNFYGQEIAEKPCAKSARNAAIKQVNEDGLPLNFRFENSLLAIFEWNADLVMTKWYSGAERIFGWRKEEILGKRIDMLDIIYCDDYAIVNKSVEKLARGKEKTVVASCRNQTKAGDIINCTWYNSVLFDQSGNMQSVLSLVQKDAQQNKCFCRSGNRA